MVIFTFPNMVDLTVSELKDIRNHLRDELSGEIHKRDALKAEIMFLQREIEVFQKEGK